MTVKLFTVGFTQKKAKDFFTLIKENQVTKLLDTRLNNVSQLCGFAKRDDLSYFLQTICNCAYEHRLDLAPTQDILDEYKKKTFDWNKYEAQFHSLLKERHVEDLFSLKDLDHVCLLCSEEEPHHCHRRLVAEYLKDRFKKVEIVHLI